MEPVATTPEANAAATADLASLKRTAGQTVGAFFYGTLLRTMRESNLKGQYGHGGRGEEVFAGQLHNLLAERLGASSNSDLAELVYRSLERQQRLISAQRSAAVMDTETVEQWETK